MKFEASLKKKTILKKIGKSLCLIMYIEVEVEVLFYLSP